MKERGELVNTMHSPRLRLKDENAAAIESSAADMSSFKSRPSESTSRIEKWREGALTEPDDKNEDRGIGTSLIDICLKCLRTLVDLAESSSGSDRAWKRLRRCHDLLRLWADGHGVHDGTFDSILDHSSNLHHAVVAILSPLCGTLLRRKKRP